MLFDDCVKVILSSIELVKKAAVLLPKKIVHYILYKACVAENHGAVQAIVKSWPHSEISFDFMSNVLCRRQKMLQQECIEAHEYFNIMCWNMHTQCIPSIALGLFNNIYTSQLSGREPELRNIDLSKILVNEDSNVQAICKLIKGEYPVQHPSDYVSSTDKKAYSIVKPKLRSMRTKIYIMLNVGISNLESLMCFQKVVRNCVNFDIMFSGIGLKSSQLSHNRLSEALTFFSSVNFNTMILDPSLINPNVHLLDSFTMPNLQSCGCLWLSNTYGSFPSQMYELLFNKLLVNSSVASITLILGEYNIDYFQALLSLPRISLRAISILPEREPIMETMFLNVPVLSSLLQANRETLEYLQLCCFSVILVPKISLEKFTKLRVLSITSRISKSIHPQFMKSPVNHLCDTLQTLQHLEYVEWSDIVNLRCKDLISMKKVVTKFLPSLQHWHVRPSKIMLFTTDLTDPDCELMVDVLEKLLGNKTGNESCNTYIFPVGNIHLVEWFASGRPDVCFNNYCKGKPKFFC